MQYEFAIFSTIDIMYWSKYISYSLVLSSFITNHISHWSTRLWDTDDGIAKIVTFSFPMGLFVKCMYDVIKFYLRKIAKCYKNNL